jgi:corrinoid protein of di/trimethylamine methyltransferase
METTQALYDAVLKGDATAAKTLTAQALAAGLPPMTLIQQFMVPAMTEVGRRFEAGEYFVPELLISARAMKGALELVRPLLTAHDRSASSAGLVVIGTVKGDLHDLGKNLVATMLEGGGFEVTDLGVNVTPEQFVKAVKERNPRIVALSALLTTTMPAIKTTLDALKQAGVRDQVKVLVGGAPITRRFADEVGADGYSETAANVADLARKVLS